MTGSYYIECDMCNKPNEYEVSSFDDQITIIPSPEWRIVGSTRRWVDGNSAISRDGYCRGPSHFQPVCICPDCIKTIKNIFNEWHKALK